MSHPCRSVKGRNQLTLGEFLVLLRRFRHEPEEQVRYDFVYMFPTVFDSYRGYYEDLALGYSNKGEYPTVGKLLEHAEACLGKDFTGWKGGEYTAREDSTLWVANSGETGSTAIVGVEKYLYITVLTDLVED